jgi:hypothetical protein
MTNLHLHLKSCYFEQVKSGNKPEEYRLDNAYWKKRLVNRNYCKVIIHNAYKSGDENRLTFPYAGYYRKKHKHPHFGPRAKRVFAIFLYSPIK